MQRYGSIVHALLAFSTVSAFAGHFRAQRPQKMHVEMSISTCPRACSKSARLTAGYIRVAGGLNKFLKIFIKRFIVLDIVRD